jgi:hypothetical protein
MKTTWPKIAILAICCIALAFEVWHFRNGSTPSRQSSAPAARKSGPGFALLPAIGIPFWSKYFASGSRAESWEPTLGDMDDAEADLAQITTLSNIDADPNRHINSPRDYYRQYLAVIVNGRRMIFLNALCSVEQNANWRKRLIVTSDGGKCFWQAIYDPSTHRFSDLKVNGRA